MKGAAEDFPHEDFLVPLAPNPMDSDAVTLQRFFKLTIPNSYNESKVNMANRIENQGTIAPI